MTECFDIIICGAGPAGCTAALSLGTSGLKVALVEKKSHPRDKVCGDALPAFVTKVLNTINPKYSNDFESLGELMKVGTCRIFSPGRKPADLYFGEHGYICRRSKFDSFLFDLACRVPNLTALQETEVLSISETGDRLTVTTNKQTCLSAKLVIGCDGANSRTKKSLTGVDTDFSSCSSAVRAYFRNVKGLQEGTIEMHFLRELLPGYFWIFPLPGNQFNVGIGMPSDSVARGKINLEKELLNIIERDPFIKARFSDAELASEIHGSLLPLWSQKSPVSGNRFMLCGDAASLVSPATGAGIGQAMQSGRYAGWQAIKCFERNNFSAEFLKSYDATIILKLWKSNIRYRGVLETVIKNPRLFDMTVSAINKSSSLKNQMIRRLTV